MAEKCLYNLNMMQDKQRVKVLSTESKVSLGKSKRLAAMRQSVEKCNVQQETWLKLKGGKTECPEQQARDVIKERVDQIKANYPQGMQNKLFALRYGSEEKISQMSLQQLFSLLGINQVLAKKIAGLKYQDKKADPKSGK